MSIVWTIIAFIVIFALLVIVHEFGHFIVAKANGIQVNEFAVGMGPKIFKFTKNGTDYVLRALPIGGACVFEEEDPFDDEEEQKIKEENPYANDTKEQGKKFSEAPLAGRLATALAGPVFNILLGFVLAMIVVGLCGEIDTTIGELMEGMPAEEAGLLPGDKIISINGERTYLFQEITLMILTSRSDDWDVVVLRNGEKMHFDVKIRDDETNGRMLGVVAADKINCANIKIFEYSFYEVRYWLIASVKSIGMLFTGRLTRDDVAGPVGVAQVIGSTIQQTKEYGFLTVFVNLVDIALLLSVNLAIMNLLPFPGLDGGRIVFLLAELILRRKIPRKFEAVVTLVGFAALMILMVVVLFNDVSKFFR
ncbi:MAG: site-2 protease family protein [Lachnospiraceae bacterium]|nr:site-2 protease family protein [Lachnospiraceae bacterium]